MFLVLLLLLWAVFILYMSTRSYQQQSIRPLLTSISHHIQINYTLPDIHIHYAEKVYSLRNNAYGFIEFIFRKFAHVFVYGVLTLLIYMLTRKIWGRRLLSYCLPLLLILMVASLDETIQKYSENRTSSPYDVLLDLSGGCLALLIAICIEWILERRRSKNSSSLIS
ncbi:VanZ family protein [Paenibacillus provencensis]|uniref:VanZ family protein n=1 Tax=Paenibacillus provencensis TaxID=441151 RepID=A0ABW3PNW2_9BACL